MVKAIIFDLDNTLFDTTEQLSEQARQAAMNAMIEAGLKKTIEELEELKDEIIKKYGPQVPVVKTIYDELELTDPNILQAGLDAYYNIEVKELELFSDVYETINELKNKGIKLAIVTTGNEELQNKKIDVLRIRKFFDVIIINDVKNEEDKSKALTEAAEKMGVNSQNILSVGDRVDWEIKLSNKLGMKTAWFVHGKYGAVEPKEKDEEPNHRIDKISQVLDLV